MANQYIQVPTDSSGKKVDVEELTVGANTVERQRVQVAGTGATDVAPVDVTTGLVVNPADRAARDNGKVDVATLDEYPPIDVDTGAGTVNALPVTWRKTAAGGPEFGTTTNPVVIDGSAVTQPISGTVTANAGTGTFTVSGTVTAAQATASSLNAEVQGDAAHDAPVSGNPILNAARASTASPTAVSADGDVVYLWALRSGALVTAKIPHLGKNADPYTLTGKTAQYTTTQTGVALWTPAAGKKLVITSYQIQCGGTTAGTLQVWFGASADTTYSRGTDLAIFDGEFAPSATLKPGVVQTGLWMASAVDHVLRVTDSAAINPLTVTVWGYEV